MDIQAVQGDITAQEVDAVVNAANQALGGCATGDAKATPGFQLPARWIIHAVGPRWRGGDKGEADLLASCYRRSLEVADELGVTSVAYPAISTGIYGYPSEDAAQIAVATLRSTPTEVELVRLVAFDEATHRLYKQLLEKPLRS